jgi:hypothetical protein
MWIEKAYRCFRALTLYSQNLNVISSLGLSRSARTERSLPLILKNFAFLLTNLEETTCTLCSQCQRKSCLPPSQSSEVRDSPDGRLPWLLSAYGWCDYVLNIPLWFFTFINQKYIIHFFTSRLAQHYVQHISRLELKNSIHKLPVQRNSILFMRWMNWVEWDHFFKFKALDKIKLEDISYYRWIDFNWIEKHFMIYDVVLVELRFHLDNFPELTISCLNHPSLDLSLLPEKTGS